MKIEIDDEARTLTIGDVRYAFDLFAALSFAPIGTVLEIVRRKDRVVTVKTITPPRADASVA